METPIKMDDLGVPLFWKHPLLILLHFVFNLPMDSYLKKMYFPRFSISHQHQKNTKNPNILLRSQLYPLRWES